MLAVRGGIAVFTSENFQQSGKPAVFKQALPLNKALRAFPAFLRGGIKFRSRLSLEKAVHFLIQHSENVLIL